MDAWTVGMMVHWKGNWKDCTMAVQTVGVKAYEKAVK